MPKGFVSPSIQPQAGQGRGSSSNPTFASVLQSTGTGAAMQISAVQEVDTTPATIYAVQQQIRAIEEFEADNTATVILSANVPISLLSIDGASCAAQLNGSSDIQEGQRKTIVVSAEVSNSDAITITPQTTNYPNTTITLNGIGGAVELMYVATNEWVVLSHNASASVSYG